jgi:hypothetical protein
MLTNPSAKDRRRAALHKGRMLIAQTWESQLNLSLFLGLLVLTVFLIPALALKHPYGPFFRDLIFSVVLISGVGDRLGAAPALYS